MKLQLVAAIGFKLQHLPSFPFKLSRLLQTKDKTKKKKRKINTKAKKNKERGTW